MPLEAGTSVGRYRVVRLIAQGGMAEVYRAEQDLAGGFTRPVALKLIRPEYVESADFREMFLDEARTACTLSHPNIVHIYEVGEVDGKLFMAMELVPGETLATVNRLLRERSDRLSNEALLAVGIFTCSALEAVHALRLPGEGHVNLVHRDVSPHNLLLSPQGALKLIDFGIAKAATNKNLTSPGITKGKAGYFSPEQAMGKTLDGRSDLFSLGVTLYKLASGQTPFDEHKTHQARNTALVTGRWAPLRDVISGLPDGLYEVVNRSLQVKPGDRFNDARAMREALENVAITSGVHVGPSSLSGYVEVLDEDEDSEGTLTVDERNKDAGRRPSSSGEKKIGEVRLGPGPTPRAPVPRVPSVETKPAVPPKPIPSRKPKGGKTTDKLDSIHLRKPFPKKLAVAVVAVAMLMGVAVVFALARSGEPVADPQRPPPHAVAQPIAEPQHNTDSSPHALPDPTEDPKPPEGRVANGTDEPERPTGAPTSPTKKPKKADKPVVVAASASEEAIGDGEGTLRISTNPPDAAVLIAGASQGTTPLNLYKIKSGRYVVELLGQKNVKGSCPVKVMPDRTTRLIYDFAAKRCALDGP